MNVRIFGVRAMKCMYAQTRPRFILSSEDVFGGMEFEPMLTPTEKSPLPENFPRGVSNPQHFGSEPKHYQLSYSGPLSSSWSLSYWPALSNHTDKTGAKHSNKLFYSQTNISPVGSVLKLITSLWGLTPFTFSASTVREYRVQGDNPLMVRLSWELLVVMEPSVAGTFSNLYVTRYLVIGPCCWSVGTGCKITWITKVVLSWACRKRVWGGGGGRVWFDIWWLVHVVGLWVPAVR